MLIGIDDNGNGVLDNFEVDREEAVCHGEPGTAGQDGAAGADGQDGQDGDKGDAGNDGLSVLYAETSELYALRSEVCPLGGSTGYFGVDTNGNGILDAVEVNVAIPIDCNTEAGLVLADEITTDRWSARRYHSSVAFNGKLWVIGGLAGSYLDDVWSSSDGVTWEEVTADAPWSARWGHSSVVFDGKLWVIGGISNGSYLDDVWSSTDGATWTQVTIAGGSWSGRYSHSSVVFSGKLWVIGGDRSYNEDIFLDDVWSSTDGVTWEERPTMLPGLAAIVHSSVAFDGKLWVIGGLDGINYLDDVWSSSDGVIWEEATASAAWTVRTFTAAWCSVASCG